MVDYLLTYGARPITASQLRVSDLDMGRGELVIVHAKHSGGWRHAVEDRHLEAWPKATYEGDPSNVPLFPHYLEDRPWALRGGSASELSHWYACHIGRKLKLGALSGIYALKRYAITSMIRDGVDPATIISFTGHLDVKQAMGYVKTNHTAQRLALAKGAARREITTAGTKVLNQEIEDEDITEFIA